MPNKNLMTKISNHPTKNGGRVEALVMHKIVMNKKTENLNCSENIFNERTKTKTLNLV